MNLLEVKRLQKSFGETQALQDCSFTCGVGEILGVVGENGSGKSTLVKILSGILEPDAGELLIRDTSVRFRSIMNARQAGIVSVPQEILVVPALSVLENVYLGRGGMFSGPPRVDFRTKAQELFATLSVEPAPLNAILEELPLAKQQLVVIVRALVEDPDLVILDESTSALDVSDRDRLFAYLRQRRERGKSAIFISHRIDELQGLVDRMTIIRNGVSVKSISSEEATVDTILRLMSGEERLQAAADGNAETEHWRFVRDEMATPTLVAESLVVRAGDSPINVSLYQGEIVGLAGLEGHGQERFLQVLAGIERPTSGQVVKTDGRRKVAIRSFQQANRLRVAYVPRDRKTEGLFLKLPIIDNFAMPLYSGLIHRRSIVRRLKDFQQRLSMRFGNENQLVGSLSGGNQQKVVLGRWLATDPQVFLLNDPTRGVDIPTKRDLYRLLRGLAQSNVSIVLLSTDLEELIELCDRVLVFRDGQIFSEVNRSDVTRDRLIASMFGKAV